MRPSPCAAQAAGIRVHAVSDSLRRIGAARRHTEAGCGREALRHRARQRGACADGGVAGAQPSLRAAGGGAPRGLPPFARPDFAGALERGGENSGRVRGRPETASGRRTGRRAHRNRRRRRRDSRRRFQRETREKARQRWGFAAGEIVHGVRGGADPGKRACAC